MVKLFLAKLEEEIRKYGEGCLGLRPRDNVHVNP
ncbi:unnamed protein product [Arabidopsis halleri]